MQTPGMEGSIRLYNLKEGIPSPAPISCYISARGINMDWSDCSDVERIPGKVSGSWLVKGTRLPVWAILENAEDHTPEEIANEIFEGVTPETVRRIINFARQHAPSPT
jgi:uncharacterized protein (DUF433 family)